MSKQNKNRAPQYSFDVRAAIWVLKFNARIIPGERFRKEIIDEFIADIIVNPDAYSCGLFLHIIHYAFVGVATIAIDEIRFGFNRKWVFAIVVIKEGRRKAKADIIYIERLNNKKKSVVCKYYILCRETVKVYKIKKMEQKALRNGDH
jgi:membrane protein CcdC involved in cytochrome C biogenesis